ncbi:MAG: transcription antitermination factor NusB [Planctomycetota bacterium]
MPDAARPPRKRTIAREVALQYLFQWDLLGDALDSRPPLRTFCDEALAPQADDPEVESFARKLIDGVVANHAAIDAAIHDTARNWSLSRMVGVDRTILRIATFELGYCPDIPPRASINEAIELAKKYSTDRSSAFVNGILDRILRRFSEVAPAVGSASESTGDTGRETEATASGSGRQPPVG